MSKDIENVKFLRVDEVSYAKNSSLNSEDASPAILAVLEAAKPLMLTKLLEECYASFLKAHGMFKAKKNEPKIPGKPLLPPLVSKNDQKTNNIASQTSPIENKALWKHSCARMTAKNKNQPITDSLDKKHPKKCSSLTLLNQDSQNNGKL